MKNCEPLVFGPLLAMERRYGCSCLSWKFSSTRQKNKNVTHKGGKNLYTKCAWTNALCSSTLAVFPGVQDRYISMLLLLYYGKQDHW